MSKEHEEAVHAYHTANQLIIDTHNPLQGINDLGCIFDKSGNSSASLLETMKGSLTMQLLLPILQHKLHLDRPLQEEEMESIRLSPYNHALWEITFRKPLAEITDHLSHQIFNDHQPPGVPKGHTHDEAIQSYNSHLQNSFDSNWEIPVVQIKLDDYRPMAVGIVDRGSSEDDRSHMALMNKLIEQPKTIETVEISLVDSPDREATLFDLISALYNKPLLDQVQVVNISQGFFAPEGNPVLEKALRQVGKPVVCSAGNFDTDDHEMPHWPSHYSNSMEHVISVGALKNGWLGNKPAHESNKGAEGVTLFAKGAWSDEIQGTSLAAAWVSHLVALSFAKNKSATYTLDGFVETVKGMPGIEIDQKDNQESRTGYRIFPSDE